MNTQFSRPVRQVQEVLRRSVLHDGQLSARDRVGRVGLGLALAGTAYTAYRFGVRRWERHWGATPEERVRSLPGDDLISDAKYRTTRAITIDAPVDRVWRWLIQLGQDRAGFYSYDGLERLIGADIYNADEIHPEWQSLAVGDDVWMAPKDRFGGGAKMTVSILEPEHALVLGPPPSATQGEGSWAFILESKDPTATRLMVRTLGRSPNVPPFFFLFDFIHFVMERKMMLGIKERAEKQGLPMEAK